MGEIALTNTINVSLSSAPRGLGEFSTNTVLLATNEAPLSAEPYIWAVNANDIIAEYGTDSLTAKMGTALFTPVPNLRTGKGQVLVVPYVATNATHGYTTTIEITTTIVNAFKLINNGELTITIDGTDYHVQGLDFTTINDLDDIVKVLRNQNLDVDIEVVDTNKIKFASRKYGATDSAVSLKATTGSAGTDIYGSSYLDGANQVTTAGTDATGVKLKDLVMQADEYGYFGAVITTQKCENSLIVENSTYIQSQDHWYFEGTKSLKNMADLGASIKSAGLRKAHLLAYSGDEKVAVATAVTIANSVNYSGTDTVLTMNLKELTGIEADLNLNQTYYNSAKTNGVDIYGSTCGLSCYYSFDNGNYVDEITGQLWLKKALEVSIFNVLRRTNTKIPQTESGMTTIKNACIQVLEQGVRNGFIGTGLQWNESIPFGDPETFQENIEKNGYYVYSIPIAQQSQVERENREAPLIQIAIKLSAAIHSSNVIVNIQR